MTESESITIQSLRPAGFRRYNEVLSTKGTLAFDFYDNDASERQVWITHEESGQSYVLFDSGCLPVLDEVILSPSEATIALNWGSHSFGIQPEIFVRTP